MIDHSVSPKRILILASYAESLINFRGPLLKEMVSLGHYVMAGAPDINESHHKDLKKMGVSVYETPLARTGLNPVKDLAYYRHLSSLIKKVSPDLVFTYTIKPNIWGAFAARKHKVKSVSMMTGLGYAFTQNNSKNFIQSLVRKIAIRLYRQATNRNHLVIFQNPDDRDDFIQEGCLADASKVRMTNGSGVDTEFYSETPLPSKPVFLMISRLLKNKGVREYGEAAVRVKKLMPEAQFLLVGYKDEGPDSISEDELNAWINGGLEYLGPTTDVRPYLARSSIYVLPSYREGTPRSVLEALSMGRPVITSDAPGCRETVVNEDNGYLVPIADVGALSDKIILLAKNEKLRQKMGAKSRELALRKFDVNQVNKVLMQHLELI